MSYYISVIPKGRNYNPSFETFGARKLPTLRKLLPNKKVIDTGGAELMVTYRDKKAAYTAASKVRDHVHGATAKVFPSDVK